MGMFDFLSKKSSNEGNVHDLIQTVRSDKKRRYEALVSLKKIGDPNAIDTFYERLQDESARIRKISIEALGEMGDISAIVHLKKVVDTQDFSKGGRRTNYGHTENVILAKEAIEKIQRRFRGTPELIIDGVNWTNNDIQLLKQSWGEGKFIQIIANLLKRSPDAIIHKLIDEGLIGYNDDNCYPKPARSGLTWSDQERTQLISELHTGKSIPEIANIHQRNKNSIFHTMVTLKSINYLDRSLLERYVPENRIEEYVPDTRIEEHVPDNRIRNLISDLENNNNSDIRNHAATQLGSFHEPSVVKALIKCVKNDPKVRYRALVSLRKIGDTTTIPVFVERSKDRSARIRLVSIIALGEIGDSPVIEHLESHIKSKDYQSTYKNGRNLEIIQAARDALQKIRSREQSGGSQENLPDDEPVDEIPEITLSLDRTQLSAERWHKLGITLTNTGLAHVENIAFAFSSEFETKGIKPISVKAGQSSRTDISIIPKNVGNILLEITLTYKDIKGRDYRTVQEFWIDVVEKGTTTPPPPEPLPPDGQVPPKHLTPKQLPPELSDRYPESEFIGKGGFARVFKAKRKDGQNVAVKIPISFDESTGRSFIIEMQNWTKLSHPNIVKLYGFNIMPVPYFEMELCDTSLDKIQKPLEPAKAAWLLFNICDGLKYTHANKIIHRDLKPHNILLKDGIPKISDWGLSKVIAESMTTSASAYTPFYAAPEQIRNKSKDERTDIWQMGVILYEITTGKLPFASDDIIAIKMQIASEEPEKPSAINPECKDLEPVILKCLEKDPAQRYQSVFELQKDLAAFLRVDFTQSLTKSMGEKDSVRSAYLCCELLQMSMKIGDIVSAKKYADTLMNYTDGENKKFAIELVDQLKVRIDRGLDEIPDELIAKADFIVHKVKIGSGYLG